MYGLEFRWMIKRETASGMILGLIILAHLHWAEYHAPKLEIAQFAFEPFQLEQNGPEEYMTEQDENTHCCSIKSLLLQLLI